MQLIYYWSPDATAATPSCKELLTLTSYFIPIDYLGPSYFATQSKFESAQILSTLDNIFGTLFLGGLSRPDCGS